MKSSYDNTLSQALGKKNLATLEYIISPGTHKGYDDGPRTLLPTGEFARACREYKEKTMVMRPDPAGRIVFLTLPFFEAPWARVYTDANGGVTSVETFGIPGYAPSQSDKDPLKLNKIYGYRFVANSVTGYDETAEMYRQGSVTVCSVPLNMDTHVTYTTSSGANPVGWTNCLDRIPVTSDQIAAATNRYVAHRAADGSYAVARHTDPHVPFTYRDSDFNKATYSRYWRDASGLDVLTSSSIGENYLAWSDDTYYGRYAKIAGTNVNTCVSAPSCMDITVTCFEGLDPAAGVIRFKCMAAWELIPKLDSPKIATSEPIPALNHAFLEALNVAETTRLAAGKAADNSLGSFLKGLVGAVSSASPLINAVASELAPPSVQKIVGKVTGALDQVAKNLESKPNGKSAAVIVKNTANQVRASAAPGGMGKRK